MKVLKILLLMLIDLLRTEVVKAIGKILLVLFILWVISVPLVYLFSQYGEKLPWIEDTFALEGEPETSWEYVQLSISSINNAFLFMTLGIVVLCVTVGVPLVAIVLVFGTGLLIYYTPIIIRISFKRFKKMYLRYAVRIDD